MRNKLREIRAAKRINQFQLRIATGIHQSRISLIENEYVEPRFDEILKLSRTLKVRPEDLFPGVSHGSTSNT